MSIETSGVRPISLIVFAGGGPVFVRGGEGIKNRPCQTCPVVREAVEQAERVNNPKGYLHFLQIASQHSYPPHFNVLCGPKRVHFNANAICSRCVGEGGYPPRSSQPLLISASEDGSLFVITAKS